MAVFIATLSYELHSQTDADAAKLLRAELVGHRWLDRFEGERMPANTLWIKRTAEAGQTTDDVHTACGNDLRRAIAAVARMGKRIALVRAWVQVTGAGSYGLVRRFGEGAEGAPPGHGDAGR
jgi:hypothetical protein